MGGEEQAWAEFHTGEEAEYAEVWVDCEHYLHGTQIDCGQAASPRLQATLSVHQRPKSGLSLVSAPTRRRGWRPKPLSLRPSRA